MIVVYFAVIVPNNQRDASATAQPTKRPTPAFEFSELYDFCAKGGYPLQTKNDFNETDQNKKHMVAVLNQITLENSFKGNYNFNDSAAGKVWSGKNGVQYLFYTPLTNDTSDIELVICEAFIAKSSLVNTCNYEGGYTEKIFSGNWDLKLYEAKTGEVIKSGTLNSSGKRCEAGINISGSGTTKEVEIITSPSQSNLEGWLSELGM
jgi:hypothetical protein